MTDKTGGFFFVIEGIDGSGKSTQIERLTRQLIRSGADVVATCEPTDGPIGRLIRKMLAGEVPVDQRTIASLFAADRTEHLVNPENGVRMLVDNGKTVVCDRYYFSSYAYHARYIDMDWVIQANRLNADILRPHATIFIDVDPRVCLQRIKERGGSLDIYEKLDIMEAVRDNYFKAFERLKGQEHVVVVNGDDDPEAVARQIWEAVSPLMLKET